MTEEGVHEVASRTGLDEEQIRNIAQRTVVNVLPKAVGIKLVDVTKPNWEDDPEAASYIEHVIDAQTQLPFEAETFAASTVVANQPAIAIEIWEQAGAAPSPNLADNHRVDNAGLIEDLERFALPADSPINIEIAVDAEGTVKLHAAEPTSGKELKISVRISVLSEEQVEEAKQIHRGLTVST